MLWDIFCRVIDNFGDIGVCWRLSADLAARGHQVRLWVDDASALDWMAPEPRVVQVHSWDEAVLHPPTPGDVVIEAFGCNPPPAFVQQMQRAKPPCWINLEYLSAQDYVERSHGLPSPVWSGPGAGLRKWFFYPGFTERTGGLLREPDLLAQRDAFLAEPQTRLTWLAEQGVPIEAVSPGIGPLSRRFVSVFCYDSAPLSPWLDALCAGTAEQQPITLLLTPGPATRLARAWRAAHPGKLEGTHGRLVLHELVHLTQPQFDRLLWSCDLNLVRGEDSAVRALWAGKPHIWQIYEQDDGVHADKLDAFMDRWMLGLDADTAGVVRQAWRHWNNLAVGANGLNPLLKMSADDAIWPTWSRQASEKLANQADLSTQLIRFISQSG